jgi:hypothetical protein
MHWEQYRLCIVGHWSCARATEFGLFLAHKNNYHI